MSLQPDLRTVNVTRYVTPLREGGSMPAIAEADDGFLYALKFRGAGQGSRALIAELICGEIARALGFKIPEIVFAKLDEAFEKEGLTPKVVFTAADADVIKTYVRLGLGVGIVADMAHDAQTDLDLVSVSASHLFSPSITSIAFRRGTFLRGYMYRFVSLFAPHLSRDIIGQFLRSQGRAEAERIFESVQVPML